MLQLPKIVTHQTKKQSKQQPGKYKSTVISVEDAPGYAPGQAVLVTYWMTGSSGVSFEYEETFRVKPPVGNHSETFFAYLANNGITEWEQFVGRNEEVNLRYEYKGFSKFLNITDRDFI